MTRFPHIFPLQLPLPLTLPLTLLLNRIRGSCRFIYWFNNQVESISRFSNPTHDEFTKSKNGISRSINQMMYSMLRFGYPKWSVIPSDERELWFRQFAV
ncbi:hypothetical protein Bca4012_092938 [Brassica carinata]